MKVPICVGVPLMVIVFDDQLAVTPSGRLVGVPIPVAPLVVCVMVVSTVFRHKVGVAEAVLAMFAGVTVMVPVASAEPHPPVNGIL